MLVQNSNSNSDPTRGNEKNDDISQDVIIVNARKESVGSNPHALSLIKTTRLEAQWNSTGSILEVLPLFLQKMFLTSTRISMDNNLSQHHKELISIAIQKMSQIEPIKSRWDDFVKKKLDIDFHLATRQETQGDPGRTYGKMTMVRLMKGQI